MAEVWSRNTTPLHVDTELYWGTVPLPVPQLSGDHIMFMEKKKYTEKLTLKAIIPTPSPDCSFRTVI